MLRLKAVKGPQHGIVLKVSRYHMVARVDKPVYGDVQRLGGVRSEGHMVHPRAAEKRRQPYAGVVYGTGSVKGLLMGAPGAVAHRLHCMYYRVYYLLRLM